MYMYEIADLTEVPVPARSTVNDLSMTWLSPEHLNTLSALGIKPPVEEAPLAAKPILADNAVVWFNHGISPKSDDWARNEYNTEEFGMEVSCQLRVLSGDSAVLKGRWVNEHVQVVTRQGPAFKRIQAVHADSLKLERTRFGDTHSFGARALIDKNTGTFYKEASSITFHQCVTMYDGTTDVVIPQSGFVIEYSVTGSSGGETPTVRIKKVGSRVTVDSYNAEPGYGMAKYMWPERD